MSVLSKMLAVGGAHEFRVHGRSIVYVDSDHTETTITAVVGEEETKIVDMEQGVRVRRRQRPIRAKLADVADPREGEYFKIDDEDWTIADVDFIGHGFAEITATRPMKVMHGARRLGGK